MKALICANCVDIRALPQDTEPVSCRCGNVTARWVDPQRGTVKVRARDRSAARILGMNNAFLMTAISREWKTDAWWKGLHGYATDAPGYLFDKSRRACWAAIVRVGETDDISWDEEESQPHPADAPPDVRPGRKFA